MKNYRAELTGVFGSPVEENPTGVVEEAAYREKDLNFRYLTIRVEKENLKAAIAGARAMNFRGFNLTIPHKVAVIPYLDELSEAASICGAVNTVVNRDGKLYGDNTDGKGFLTSLKESGTDPAGRTVTIFGAGGAARAIAVELALAGASEIHIINRTPERGKGLAELIREKTSAEAEFLPLQKRQRIPEDTDILVQCTNIGLYPDVSGLPDLDYDSISKNMVCCDVVFNRPHTPFLARCEERGAHTIDGLGMLVNQAALNFTLWTGEEAPKEVMKQALLGEFGK